MKITIKVVLREMHSINEKCKENKAKFVRQYVCTANKFWLKF